MKIRTVDRRIQFKGSLSDDKNKTCMLKYITLKTQTFGLPLVVCGASSVHIIHIVMPETFQYGNDY